MGHIQIMPTALANQIAAGEVVERPASCVKELLENSLDAGATKIQVKIEEGGIGGITVQDNGSGMDEQDAMLAFSRHATSKVSQSLDLFRIRTLGFRGEALAAIAAVAKVTLQTRAMEALQGTLVQVEGTTIVNGPQAVGMPPGTKIHVTDLFYNTPARLKYLRSVHTEQARCLETVQRAALARPDVGFRYENDGHLTFQTAGRGNIQEVLAALHGVGEAKQFIPVQAASTDYRIHGFIGRPTQAKSSRAHGYLFVNRRPIRNLAIHQAIVQGYAGRLMVNRHPLYALYIEMDPVLVDVNIHPHKSEVRFSEEKDLCTFILHAVKEALDQVLMVPDFSFGDRMRTTRLREKSEQQELSFPPVQRDPSNTDVSHRSTEFSLTHRQSSSSNAYSAVQHKEEPKVTREKIEQVYGAAVEKKNERPMKCFETIKVQNSVEKRLENWNLRPIGQALGNYIIADDGENIYVIDQHAAHERVLYETFMKKMIERETHSIPLLTPLTITLSPKEYAFWQEEEMSLRDMGLQLEGFGGYEIVVRTIPDIWEGLEVSLLIQDILQEISEGQVYRNVKSALRELVVMRACKAAIKANWYLSQMEMEALCTALSQLEDPFHCPHGRPVFIRLSNHELEKEFRRIV